MRTATMPKYRVGRNNEYTPVNKKDQLLRFANTKTGSGFIEYIKIHYLSVNGTGIPVRYNQAGNPIKNEFCKIRQKEYEKNIVIHDIFLPNKGWYPLINLIQDQLQAYYQAKTQRARKAKRIYHPYLLIPVSPDTLSSKLIQFIENHPKGEGITKPRNFSKKFKFQFTKKAIKKKPEKNLIDIIEESIE